MASEGKQGSAPNLDVVKVIGEDEDETRLGCSPAASSFLTQILFFFRHHCNVTGNHSGPTSIICLQPLLRQIDTLSA